MAMDAYGVHGYTHTFKVGDDVRANVSVTGHTMKVTRTAGRCAPCRSMRAAPSIRRGNGTMAVIDKQAKVHMTSCSVGISCDKGSSDYYDLTLPWDVHPDPVRPRTCTTPPATPRRAAAAPVARTAASTSPCRTPSGSTTRSSRANPVTITGSPRAKAPADNGYAAFNLGWDQWLAGSASGEQPTATL
ncbi:hypothetical protein GCM10017687_24020 [Streptomyces echinatus]